MMLDRGKLPVEPYQVRRWLNDGLGSPSHGVNIGGDKIVIQSISWADAYGPVVVFLDQRGVKLVAPLALITDCTELVE